MEWLYLTILSALIWGVLSVIAKDIMKDTASTVYTTLYSLLALVFYTPVFLYYLYISGISYTFAAILALTVSIIANVLAFIAYNYSIDAGELSQVIPFTRLTPIFAAIFGSLILNETIDITLGAGIISATAGSIILLKEDSLSYIKSLEDGLRKDAIKAALISSILYGGASVADRYANQIINPEIYTFFIFLGMTTALLAICKYKLNTGRAVIEKSLREYPLMYAVTGLLAALASLSIFKAFSLAPASQVTPVLQVQVLIPMLAGVLLFNEKNLLRKMIGTAILITGVILVAI